MKVLIVGSDRIFSIENFYIKYLREAGTEVILFRAPELFHEHYGNNIFNKILFRTGLSPVLKKINEGIKTIALKEQPDIVWVFKGMEILPDTLKWLKNQSVKLANYNPDNPFIFSGRGSGNGNVTQSVPLYDLHFTYNRSIYDRLIHEFNLKTCILPFGFEVRDDLFAECENLIEIDKVCFLGNPDKERAAFIKALAEAGFFLDVYGNHWSRFINHPNVKTHDPVYGDEQWRVLRKYRAQLNLMRKHNLDSHNMRSFEVPGIGGIMVAPDTPDHRQFFENGKEVFLFDSVANCIDQLRSVLKLDTSIALKIRDAARRRSISSGYTYRDRATQVWREFQKQLNE